MNLPAFACFPGDLVTSHKDLISCLNQIEKRLAAIENSQSSPVNASNTSTPGGLWHQMYEAAASATGERCDVRGKDGAAMIRAVAKYVERWAGPRSEIIDTDRLIDLLEYQAQIAEKN